MPLLRGPSARIHGQKTLIAAETAILAKRPVSLSPSLPFSPSLSFFFSLLRSTATRNSPRGNVINMRSLHSPPIDKCSTFPEECAIASRGLIVDYYLSLSVFLLAVRTYTYTRITARSKKNFSDDKDKNPPYASRESLTRRNRH